MNNKFGWTPTWPENNPLNNVLPAVLWIAPLFIMAMRKYGSLATVNHGTDGKHSANSAHYKGQAVDINHKDMRFPWQKDTLGPTWYSACYQFSAQIITIANQLSRVCNESVTYYLVLEASHLHMEITLHGESPNIKGWEKGRFVYITEEVKSIIRKGGDTNGQDN